MKPELKQDILARLECRCGGLDDLSYEKFLQFSDYASGLAAGFALGQVYPVGYCEVVDEVWDLVKVEVDKKREASNFGAKK